MLHESPHMRCTDEMPAVPASDVPPLFSLIPIARMFMTIEACACANHTAYEHSKRNGVALTRLPANSCVLPQFAACHAVSFCAPQTATGVRYPSDARILHGQQQQSTAPLDRAAAAVVRLAVGNSSLLRHDRMRLPP